jgi:uncharacterized membrane protein
MQETFKQQGVGADQAQIMATYLVQGAGVVIIIWGYAHKIVKDILAKKSANTPKSQTGIPSGTGMLLIFAFIFSMAAAPQAKDTFRGPFDYLSLKQPAPDYSSDSGHWYIRPVVSQSVVSICKDKDGLFIANLFSGTGLGIAWERTIVVEGKYYSAFGLSASILFSPVVDGKEGVNCSGDIVASTLDNWIGAGVRADGKKIYFVLKSTVNIL